MQNQRRLLVGQAEPAAGWHRRRGHRRRGTGGAGAVGGSGGNSTTDAGTYNASNTISGLTGAAGITLAIQNSGHASLIQSSVNVQANINGANRP